jgi:DNA-binding Xre family transcriptional regulator
MYPSSEGGNMTKRIKNRLRELLAIKERQDGRNYSQREVAESLGLSKVAVDRFARNETTRFDEHIVLALCEFLGCGIGDLLIIEEVSDEQGQLKTLLASA